MIVYNVTVKVDHDVASKYLDWVKEKYIPAAIQTGCFSHASIYHLLEMDDEDGITYAIQFHANDLDQYKKYLKEFEKNMQISAVEKWGNKFIEFSTVMRAVN